MIEFEYILEVLLGILLSGQRDDPPWAPVKPKIESDGCATSIRVLLTLNLRW